ncbi:DUF2155 domain-containing protein [Ferrovibrio xuzhouensis]|uniref:DUF2155 domain-containing protein n=1 Tax=Ferrovibrio xuzhouensis TaxID=1576914 RepID=A0ABV7VL93_9PROT
MTRLLRSARFLRSVGLVLLAGGIAAGPAAGQQTAVPPLPTPSDNTPQYPSNPMPIAVLQGLDKITARIYTFEAPVGQTIGFGTLKVTVRTCRKRPPEYPPESAAYLDIIEQRPGEEPVERFHGWMFASSPALNPLEHPVYDVWVIDCKASAGGTSAPKQ